MSQNEYDIVRKIAARFSVPLSDRSCTGNHMWDGKTLATRWNPTDYKAEEDWYQKNPCGLFNLEDFFLPSQPVEADLLLHDIGHHLFAPEYCRDLPEWGLAPVLGGDKYLANGGYHKLTSQEQERFSQLHYDGVVDHAEQTDSEAFAYLFGITMSCAYGVARQVTALSWLALYKPHVTQISGSNHKYENRLHMIRKVAAFLNEDEKRVMYRLIG